MREWPVTRRAAVRLDRDLPNRVDWLGWPAAVGIANLRAERTGVRHRVHRVPGRLMPRWRVEPVNHA